MTEEMFGGQHRIDELTQAEQTVRVNTDETTGTVSNKYAHLRECMGVQKERKNQKKRLLTRPASLEMTHYPDKWWIAEKRADCYALLTMRCGITICVAAAPPRKHSYRCTHETFHQLQACGRACQCRSAKRAIHRQAHT